MDKGNVLDKTWIALELTKICYKNKENIITEEVYNTFSSYMEMLFDTKLEELDKIKEYKRRILDLNMKYADLQKEFDSKLDEIMDITFKNAIEMLDSYKADMENYAYNNLKALLTTKK